MSFLAWPTVGAVLASTSARFTTLVVWFVILGSSFFLSLPSWGVVVPSLSVSRSASSFFSSCTSSATVSVSTVGPLSSLAFTDLARLLVSRVLSWLSASFVFIFLMNGSNGLRFSAFCFRKFNESWALCRDALLEELGSRLKLLSNGSL